LGVIKYRLTKQVIGVAAAALLAAACASSSGTPEGASDPRGDLSEGKDPGMSDRGGSDSGMQAGNGDFRTIYFAFDDYSLSGTSKNSLQQNATLLQASPSSRLEIQGNTDERGTEEYNLALGKRRAEAAKQYLVDLGVGKGQLTTISFGEENPAVRGSTEAAWAKNRRDDFVLR